MEGSAENLGKVQERHPMSTRGYKMYGVIKSGRITEDMRRDKNDLTGRVETEERSGIYC
jgi:hypothetical protein